MYVMTDFAWALARKGESQMNATTTPKKKQTAETIDTAASSATAPERQKPDNRRQRSQKAGAARNKAGRKGTKTARVITLLERASGASLKTLMKATGWQAHYADVQIMPTCVGNPFCGPGIAAMESA
jgi:hypothetical protein